MTTIVTRAGKGSPLTHTEVDTNFTNLNTAKLETAAIPLGTLQAPSVSFLNDSDTGIFCPQGGNSLAIATGAQYAITCTSTQAVGIKTANPQKALHVAGATRVGADDATDAFLEIGEGATGNRNSYIDIVGDTTYTDYGLRFIRNNTGANATSEIKHRGTGNLNFTTQEAGAIVFNTTNSPRVTILPAGNVGIGSSSPVATNHIRGTGTSGQVTASWMLENGSSGTAGMDITGAAGSSIWRFLYGGGPSTGTNTLTPALTIGLEGSAAGRVGIGTTTPRALLDVGGSTAFNGGTYQAPKFAVSNGYISIKSDPADGVSRLTLIGDSTTGDATIDWGGNANANLIFSNNGSNRARIDSSGRLLVGTSTARTNNSEISTIDGNIALVNDDAYSTSLTRQFTYYSSTASYGVQPTANIVFNTVGDATSAISFWTRSSTMDYAERARIDSSGRLLVGTSAAPTVGVPASATFVVQGYAGVPTGDSLISLQRGQAPASISSGSQLGAITFGANDGSPYAQIHAATDGAGGANDYPGRLVFSTTADGAASPTERMRIQNNGVILARNSAGDTLNLYNAVSAGASNAFIYGLHSSASAYTGTTSFIVYTNGNVVNTNGSYTTISDAKLKENIVSAGSQWDDIKAIQIRNWNFKVETGNETHRQIGPIAQEVEAICPGLVFEIPDRDQDGNETGEVTKGINQSVLYMKAVKALQEAMERIEQLEADVAALKA